MITAKIDNQGFTLVDTLLAVLIFSISVIALFQYQAALTAEYVLAEERQSVWRIAHQLLESYPQQDDSLLPDRWQKQTTMVLAENTCQKVTVSVISPHNKQAKLTRWFCDYVQ